MTDALTLLELASTQDAVALRREIARHQSLPPRQSGEPPILKRLGIAWHNLATDPATKASARAEGYLHRARKADPADHEVTAFLGSAQTLVARDAWNPATKALQLNSGLALMDKAVRLAPDNVVVRMVRMTNSLSLPAFMGRAPKAREDLLRLHACFASQPPHPALAAEVCCRLADLLQQEGRREQAQALYVQVLELAPDSVWGRRAALRQRPR
ncbi:hypothetical protein F2Q65_06405 [Thiohalocapsa marina]|uniref:Uncharacterized protein n=1 Tax=Thiohalocapsa marina TaxID=424902 RepID=A0A5M8FQF6_9GAMM|nr:tetratricopeptide repeat protein [Thiohalocapsa marina]KAA6185996.1 hypothetical protein F2Q65_06405 [Thiohalocapsa marina]